jgi:uncharacterized membrane protein YbaN (DUF454 family)
MKQQLYLSGGFLSLSAGVIGIFLPVLPTTPFLLLSIWLFHKTDTKFEQVILNNRWIGSHIRRYVDERRMTTSFKWKAILFVWLGLGVSIYLQSNLYMMILLGVIGIAVTTHIVLLNQEPHIASIKELLDANEEELVNTEYIRE